MSRQRNAAEVLGEWREEAEHGRLVDPEKLIASHPELAQDLRRYFEAQGILDDVFAEMDERPVQPPATLGDYRLGREVGRGGMGVVYEAEQISMERRVALKVLFPTIATTVATRKRFEREARLTGRLHHTNIVTVHAMGQQDGHLYFAMELVEGRSLDTVIEHIHATEQGEPGSSSVEGLLAGLRGPKAQHFMAELFAGVADALQVAHSHGAIHRDVKPSNLILDGEGVLKLTDFGLARLVGDRVGLTRTGEVLGTPLYMSPEMLRSAAREVDHRTDIYSLGTTMYEMLTGQRAHNGEDLGAICSSILTQPPRSLRVLAPDLHRDLRTIVEKAMAKERADRYGSAGEMAADLRAFSAGRSIRARPLGPVARTWRSAKRHKVRSALVLLVLLAAGVAIVARSDSEREQTRRRLMVYTELVSEAERMDVGPARAMAAYDDAIEAMPQRPEAWLSRAFTFWGRERPERVADLTSAAARGLGQRTVHLARAALLGRFHRGAEADAEEARADAAPDAAPRDSLFRGLVAVHRGDCERAQALLLAASDGLPAGGLWKHLAFMGLAAIAERDGDYMRALEHLNAAYGSVQQPSYVMVLGAYLLHRAGSEEAAAQRFQRVLDTTTPKDPLSEWHTLCRATRDRSLPAWLRALAEAGLRVHPMDLRLLWARVTAMRRQGRLDAAFKAADEALGTAPECGPLLVERGYLRFLSGEREKAVKDLRHAIELQGPSPLASATLARCLLARGDADSALAEIDRALALRPRALKLLLARACALRSRGDLPGTIALLEQARALRPMRPEFYNQGAADLKQAGRIDEALRVLAEGCRRMPDEPALLEEHVKVLRHVGQSKRAQEVLEKVLARARRAAASGRTTRSLLRCRALALRLAGSQVEATQAYEALLAEAPEDVSLLRGKAHLLLSRGLKADAVATLRAATKVAPGHSYAWSDLGTALWQLGQFTEAAVAFRRCVRLGRGSLESHKHHHNLGLSLQKSHAFSEAAQAFAMAVRLAPHWASGWWGLAAVQWEEGKRDEALESYRRAINGWEVVPRTFIDFSAALHVAKGAEGAQAVLAVVTRGLELFPDNPLLLRECGVWLIRTGRPADAVPHWKALAEAEPTARNWVNYAAALHMSDQPGLAVEACNRALALEPGSIAARLTRAYAYHDAGEAHKALGDFETALADSKGHPGMAASLAHFLLITDERALRDPPRALELARAAARVQPKLAGAHFAVGMALLRMKGSPEEAIEAFGRTVTLQQSDPLPNRDLGYALALAHARGGEVETARSWLSKGDTWYHLSEANGPVSGEKEPPLRREAREAIVAAARTSGR